MKGLWKLTNAANRMEAVKDWQAISDFAHASGYGDYADALKPADNAGWRRIDRQIDQLRKFMESGGLEVPKSPSAGSAPVSCGRCGSEGLAADETVTGCEVDGKEVALCIDCYTELYQ